MKIICPECSHEHDEPAAFCEECGAELKSVQTTHEVAKVDYSALAGMIGTKTSAWDLSACSKAAAENPAAVSPAMSCEHLKVEYRENLFFLAGVQIPFELKLTPLLKEIKSLLVWFSPQIAGSKNVVYEIPLDDSVRLGRTIQLQIPWRPDENLSGLVPFRFFFGCLLENGVKFYSMRTQHQIYRKGQSAESVVNQITINASEAGTINAGFKDLLSANRGRSTDELLDELNRMPRTFTVKTLEETLWRPENTNTEGRVYPCDKITLEIAGHLYQIIGKEQVKFGRKAELNDIVVADMLQGTTQRDYPNNTISRTHAQIHYCGDSVNIFDSSTYGTFINDVRPLECGVPVPNEASVEFGDILWRMEMQHCEQRPETSICKVCPAHKIKSIVFTRRDKVAESYLLVWECCELGFLSKTLAGFTLVRRNGGFILKTPGNRFIYLVPGRTISENDLKIRVQNFHQYGF